ncbi:response regulator [Treponema sp. HNW]|uniref:response regulator n=1 Tax=Treponema sp. HNW TaxID=3116654 RepID=UPI003D0CDCA2
MVKEKLDYAGAGRFLANTIHEVRTPIQTIIGTLELLQQTNLDTEQTEYARQIQFGAEVLLSLANNILDFTKIQSGKIEIEKIPMDIIGITEQTIDLICIEAHNRGLEIVTDFDYTIPPFIKADPVRIQQILLNFIKNAVKFTAKGYIRVRLCQQDNGTTLLFEVEDSGIGIPEEKQRHLFKDFYQVHVSTTRKYGGTGLGLSICKSLVTLMGGEVGMRSNPLGGSVFWFSLPLEKPSAEEMKTALDGIRQRPPNPRVPENTSVLLVDDSKLALRSLCAKLKVFNVKQIDTASSGEQALRQMRRAASMGTPYSLVFIDMLMPAMDGWYLATEINNDTSINNSKLYLMVPEGQMGGEAKMKMLDWFNGYLYKPIKLNMLKEMLLTHFNTPLDLEVVEPSVRQNEFSAAGLTVLAVEDHPVNQKLIQTFLKQFGAEVLTANDGQEAVDCIKENPHIDLVFMDILLPLKTGLQATIEVREAGYKGIIIACTANTDPSDFNLYLSNGMNDILTKPFKRKNIEDVLKKWDAFVRKAQQSDIPSAELPAFSKGGGEAAKSVDNLWDIPRFMNDIQNDKHTASDLIERYIFQTGHLARRIRDCLENKEFARLESIGTAIRESSADIKTALLTEAGRDLEYAAKRADLTEARNAFKHICSGLEAFKKAAREFLLR